MKFFKLIRYDIKNGFWQSKWRLLSIVIIVLISCVEFFVRKSNTYYFEEIVPAGTFGDYLCYLFAGIPEYHPGADQEFIFPVKWFLFHLILLYGTLHYSVRDLHSLGIIILPRCRERSFWWLSKCFWNVLYIVVAYLLTFATIFLFCILTGETLTLPVTGEFINLMARLNSSFIDLIEFPIQFSVMLLIVPCLFSIGNSLLLLLLTLFLKPVISYGAMMIFFLCGAYFNSPFWWEGLTMAVRSEWVIDGGYTVGIATIIAGAVIISTMVIGLIRFRKYDILNLESE